MKRALLILSIAVLGVTAKAQDFKPTQGDVTTEFGLTGGINNTNFNLNEGAGMLRFRYFQKENLAYRLGFNVGSNNVTKNAYGTDNKEGSAKSRATDFLVNLGVEKHFAGTERLSPYVGGDILFGAGTRKVSFENATGPANAPLYADNTSSESKGPGYVSFGLRGVIGADYYIAKRLFLGVEAGFGFAYEKEGKKTNTTTVNGTTTTVKVKSAGNNFEINPSIITGVRVGFAF